MAELTINADEIAAALRTHVETFTPVARARRSVGRVLEVGDGIARVAGLPETVGQRAARVRGRHARPRAEPRRGHRSARSSSARPTRSRRAARSRRPAASSRCRSATRSIGRVVERARPADRRQGPDRAPTSSAASRCRRPASSAASRCTSRCRPASRPSTP